MNFITKYQAPCKGYNPLYSSGKNTPKYIVIHHWGMNGAKAETIAKNFTNVKIQSSAHYVVGLKEVYRLMSEKDCAWHAGSKAWNQKSIGIECRTEMDDVTYNTVVELIADIYSRYGALPIVGHKDIARTACPGKWYAKLSDLKAKATKLYQAHKTGSGTSSTSVAGKLTVDGVWGVNTTKALQKKYKLSQTGTLASQNTACKKYLPAAHTGSWKFITNAKGCSVLKKLQAIIGTTQDGVFGKNSVTALQKYLNKAGYKLTVDGIMGTNTVKALQKWLNK